MSLRRLHRTYAAVRPELGRARLLALTLHGALAHAGAWAGTARLAGLGPGDVDRAVAAEGLEPVLAGMRRGRGQVLVLLHQGHWELAGAWAARSLGGLTTVAEVLPPRSPAGRVATRARRAAGLDVVPADAGAAGARHLLRVLRGGGAVALLADRDLVDRGLVARRVPVTLAGVTTTLAAGPAELALAARADLRPVTVATHRRHPRHRVVLGDAVPVPHGPRAERVRAMTQACADVLGESVRRRTADWHLTGGLP